MGRSHSAIEVGVFAATGCKKFTMKITSTHKIRAASRMAKNIETKKKSEADIERNRCE